MTLRLPNMMLALLVLASAGAVQLSAQDDDGGRAAAPAAQTVRFDSVEIWIDSKDQPLAAYQIEFTPDQAAAGTIKIVGIEGGEHAEFANPPFYDPKAMQQERVIIAAFSMARAESLPTGRTRTATIHVQISGEAEPGFKVEPTVIATLDGKPIEAKVELK